MPERFVIVGAQRSGTTYLYELLDEHPQISLAKPMRPEPKFFLLDELYQRGLGWYEEHFFQDTGGATVLGEKSTSYYESDRVADRIAQAYPDAKIVFLLREPIERALSNYWFSHGNGFESLPVDEALTPEAERRDDFDPGRVSSSPFAYLSRGHYVEHLDRYVARFPREQIRILLTEQLVESDAAYKELLGWLGVSQDFHPSAEGSVVNATPRSQDLSPASRRTLEAYFEPHNQALATRYDLDLTCWAPS